MNKLDLMETLKAEAGLTQIEAVASAKVWHPVTVKRRVSSPEMREGLPDDYYRR